MIFKENVDSYDKNIAGIGLRINGRKVGVINCINKKQNPKNITDSFSLPDKELLSIIASIIERFIAYFRRFHQHVDIISHELMTPLNRINGNTSRIVQGIDLNQELQNYVIDLPRNKSIKFTNYVDLIRGETQSIKYAIQNAEYAHKVNSGGNIKVYRNITEFRSVIREIVRSFRSDLDRLGLTLKIEFQSFPERLDCDETAIKQVIVNILKNAMRYSHRIEGQNKPIEIYYEYNNNHRISVVNYGSVIDDDEREKIFEYGFRSRNIKDQNGSGIALFVCKNIMSAHNGEIILAKWRDPVEFTIVL